MVDWPSVIKDLAARGWTQVLLAERLGVSQPRISDISTGKIRDPRFALASALKALHDSGERAPTASIAHRADDSLSKLAGAV